MSTESLTGNSLDDRSPYEAAAAVARKITELSPDFPNEDAVWEAFAKRRGADQLDYIHAIRRTQHSIFYYQLQFFYEFGIERVPAQFREQFIYSCGRHFLKTVLTETIYPLLQVSMAKPGDFQATVVAMIRVYLNRYGGNRYRLTEEVTEGEIILHVEDCSPGMVASYVRQFGLVPERCFQNSVNFIVGGVHEFIAQVVERFEPPAVPYQIAGHRASIRLAVTESDRFAFERLLETLMQFVQQVHSRQGAAGEERQLESDLVLESESMREMWNRLRRASQSDEIVLLLGESGTGKTFIAEKIHQHSRRKDRPFINVCLTSDIGSENLIQSNLFGHEKGAFTGATEHKQGLFSLADGGTILLDEIGDASLELQAKLLRVVESSTFKRLGGVKDISVDVRVIAATNRNLEQLVAEGKFREDLYYRLNVIPICVPPLRERPEAIPALLQFFLGRLNRSSRSIPRRMAPGLVELLQQYSWPGNVRELQHAMKHAVAMSEGAELSLAAFPQKIRDAIHGKQNAKAFELPANGAASVINTDALRKLIRATDAKFVANTNSKHDLACHIDFAKRCYLASLIEELNGDLTLIGHYWDHHSEKTLRALIQTYGLGDVLQSSRDRARQKNKSAPQVSI